jgi:hypothetical protein
LSERELLGRIRESVRRWEERYREVTLRCGGGVHLIDNFVLRSAYRVLRSGSGGRDEKRNQKSKCKNKNCGAASRDLFLIEDGGDFSRWQYHLAHSQKVY